MPRKAPNLEGGVIEHRMTLGDLERSQIIPMLEDSRQLLKSKRTAVQINNVKDGVIASAFLVGSLGVGVAGYAVYQWVNDVSIIHDLKNYWQMMNEADAAKRELFKNMPKGGPLNPVLPWWLGPLRFF